MKTFLAFLTTACTIGFVSMCLTLAPPAWGATDTMNAYLMNLDTVVQIHCTWEDKSGKVIDEGAGTGSIISQTRVLTAAHVIKGATVCVIDSHKVTVVSEDDSADVAVLRDDHMAADGRVPVLPINCDGFQPEHGYFSFGFAYSEDFAMQLAVFHGVYQAYESNPEDVEPDGVTMPAQAHMAKLSGALYSGMSGGPIINLRGEIVGINNVGGGLRAGSMLSRALQDTKLCAGMTLPPVKVEVTDPLAILLSATPEPGPITTAPDARQPPK